jgi:hypothetical protein
VPWVPLDTHYLDDPKIQAAGSMTPFALSAFPALLADAMSRADGGKVEVTFRSLAFALFISEDEAEKAVQALIDTGVLEAMSRPVTRCHAKSQRVGFAAWSKWNARYRKARERERKAHE